MKRILMVMAVTLISALSFGQLQTKTVEESRGYITIYTAPMNYGEIRYIEDTHSYILFGATDNRFEDSMASIYLGNTKESALLTLEDIRKIATKETKLNDDIIVKGINNRNTQIGKLMGEIVFETEGVAGTSHLLWAMKKDFTKASKCISDFNN